MVDNVLNDHFMNLIADRYSNNKTKGNKALFICCGRKNQANNKPVNPILVSRKYFFTNVLLLLIKNDMMICVGHAQSKL